MKPGDRIKIEHGAGGAMSRELVEEVIYPAFRSEAYSELLDASPVGYGTDLQITTDGYVVDPPFFPGSDIGRLAVFGTTNDLAVSGAVPLCIALALVIEEGFPIEQLRKALDSAAEAAREAGVRVVTGDTKVVPRGKGGGIYITTTGIGRKVFPYPLSPNRIQEGDRIIVSGPIGSHGLAVLAARESLPVAGSLRSDAAPLFPAASRLFSLGESLRFMRDATRGGIAAVLNEMVQSAAWGAEVDEESFPVSSEVRVVSSILGINPLEVANEGVLVAVVAGSEQTTGVSLLRSDPLGEQAVVVGKITRDRPGTVVLRTKIGGRRLLDYPRGLLLPRIC